MQQSAVLKRLRVKFVALTMTAVTAVLVVAFSTICYLDYRQSEEGVYASLDAAIDRAISGASSGLGGFGDVPWGTPPEIGGHREKGERIIPTAVYLVTEEGVLEMADFGSTAVISDEVLVQALTLLANEPDGSGDLGSQSLYYAKRTTPFGVCLAFADASAASSWQQLALLLLVVGAATLALFLVVSAFFSRWALRPVERAWDQQRRFIADASHELKTPLTVILANTSILRSHPERSVASQSQWVESTQVEAERMQELVCDMLELAKPGDATAAKETWLDVDFTEVVEHEVLQFESVAYERRVAIDAQLAPEVWLRGDEARLRRLVSTLVDNACKYSEEGGVVKVLLSQSQQSVRLSVCNQGQTISSEDLPHVFDRFYRADSVRTSGSGSYGLGLSIARDVAEQHGGSISVESNPSSGTVFTVEFGR